MFENLHNELSEAQGIHESPQLDSDADLTTHFSRVRNGDDFLRNTDYSLDSPLIHDWIRELKLSLSSQKPRKLLSHIKQFRDTIKDIKADKLSLEISKAKSDLDTQKPIFKLLLEFRQTRPIKLANAWEEVTSCFKKCTKTESVVNTFFHLHQLGSSRIEELKSFLRNQSLELRDIQIWNYWFLVFHFLVIMMNERNKEDRYSVDIPSYLEIQKRRTPIHSYLEIEMLGDVFVYGGLLYLRNHNLCLDKNFVLMLKDICLSRFNSLICIIDPVHFGYSSSIFSDLRDLYESGDKLIHSLGNKGYSIVKMLEPTCIKTIKQISEASKPDIRPFQDFEDYLDNEWRSLIRDHGKAAEVFHRSIIKFTHLKDTVFAFGTFRHWGHPYVNYEAGLEKLNDLVTQERDIDEEYVNQLASDLAKVLLDNHFKKTRAWAVDLNSVDPDHPLRPYIVEGVWPRQWQISKAGDCWNTLPLTKMFDIPELVHPSEILDDKSHSMTRKDVIQFLRNNPGSSIPSKKVMLTTLQNPMTRVKEFIEDIAENGLEEDDLIIGLKAKERELKESGRFFALMSYKLRMYIVLSESMIAKEILRLFPEVTMTDDGVTLIEKMINRVDGHGTSDYERVTYQRHLDYEKWNNYQRHESTAPVFEILSKAFGVPGFFERTHKFFQESIIYYPDRGDRLTVVDNQIAPVDQNEFFYWNGQAGGLEGLRQKGWSLISALMLRRNVTDKRNTKVKLLLQGDNQIVSTTYQIHGTLDEMDKQENLENVHRNCNALFESLLQGSQKLGLKIKKEETMCTHNYFIYGKIHCVAGRIIPCESKRVSRIGALSNDQIPNLSNLMSTSSTNSLTVCQQADTIQKSIRDYWVFSIFTVQNYLLFSPILRKRVMVQTPRKYETLMMKCLFQSPSIGGWCGISLNRFLIRQFPDPVSEELSFWRNSVEHSMDSYVKEFGTSMGYPKCKLVTHEAFHKLIENPVSLNIDGYPDLSAVVREAVVKALNEIKDRIVHEEFHDAISHSLDYKGQFFQYLMKITPCFPRFISEFYTSSKVGLEGAIIGLIQGSKTIRNYSQSRFGVQVSIDFVSHEEQCIKKLVKEPSSGQPIWTCSSTLADQLREKSWQRKIYGMTVPHPSEMFEPKGETPKIAKEKGKEFQPGSRCWLSVSIAPGDMRKTDTRGSLRPYMGSSTKEGDSIIDSRLKSSLQPHAKKAIRLLKSINWFIREESNLANDLLQNARVLVGDLPENFAEKSPARTGSALHRKSSERVSSGGYTSINPNFLSFVSCTAETLEILNKGDLNYDFMYQSSMIHCQALTVSDPRFQKIKSGMTVRWYLKCTSCIRSIEEIELDVPPDSFPFSKEGTLNLIYGDITLWKIPKSVPTLPIADWTSISQKEKCIQIGLNQGLAFGILLRLRKDECYGSTIFPINLPSKLIPEFWLEGLFQGLYLSSMYALTTISGNEIKKSISGAAFGSVLSTIESLTNHPTLSSYVENERFFDYISRNPHSPPPSYPSRRTDLCRMIRNFLMNRTIRELKQGVKNFCPGHLIILFSEFREPAIQGLVLACIRIREILSENNNDTFNDHIRERYQSVKEFITYLLDDETEFDPKKQTGIQLVQTEIRGHIELLSRDEEFRHAAKSIGVLPTQESCTDKWGKYQEFEGSCEVTEVLVADYETDQPILPSPFLYNPLISGLRAVQLATGAHYKLKTFFKHLPNCKNQVLVVGDGSGGMSAAFLRKFPEVRVLFNSLLVWTDEMTQGLRPGLPASLAELDERHRIRIINSDSIWERPSDIRNEVTWEYFQDNLSGELTDVVLCDAELTSVEDSMAILNHMMNFILKHSTRSTGVIKCYLSMMRQEGYTPLQELKRNFNTVKAIHSRWSSSFTSEIYVIFSHPFPNPRKYLELSPETVLSLNEHNYSRKSIQSEWERGLNIKRWQVLMGFPDSVISPPNGDILSLSRQLGMDPGMTVSKLNKITTASSYTSGISAVIAWMMSISNKRLNIFLQLDNPHPPPSDPVIERHFNMMCGVWIAVAYHLNRIDLFYFFHEMMNSEISYYFSNVRYDKGQYRLTWKLHNRGNDLNKRIRQNKTKADSAVWFRVVYKLFQKPDFVQPSEINWREVERYLSDFTNGQTLGFTLRNSGLVPFDDTEEQARSQEPPYHPGGAPQVNLVSRIMTDLLDNLRT